MWRDSRASRRWGIYVFVCLCLGPQRSHFRNVFHISLRRHQRWSSRTYCLSLSLHALAASIANCVRLSRRRRLLFKHVVNTEVCDATLRPAALTAV